MERHPGEEVRVTLESQDWPIRDMELADIRGQTAWWEVGEKVETMNLALHLQRLQFTLLSLRWPAGRWKGGKELCREKGANEVVFKIIS